MASYSDDFNRANGALGASWQTVAPQTAPTIVSNAAVGAALSIYYQVRYVSAVDTDDMYIEVVVGPIDVSTEIGLELRSNSTATHFVRCWFMGDASGSVGIQYNIGGGVVSPAGGTGGAQIVAGDIVRFTALGRYFALSVNGVIRTAWLDSAAVTSKDSSHRYGGFHFWLLLGTNKGIDSFTLADSSVYTEPYPVAAASAAIAASRTAEVTFTNYYPAANDLVVFFPNSGTAGGVPTAPAGFTNVLGGTTDVESDVHEICCITHVVTAAEAADQDGTVTFTATDLYDANQTGNVLGCILRNTANVVDSSNTWSITGNSTSHHLPALTGTNLSTGSIVIAGVALDSNTAAYATRPDGWAFVTTSVSTQAAALLLRGLRTVSGVDVADTTITAGGSGEGAAITLALAKLETGTITAALKKATASLTGSQTATGMSGTVGATAKKVTASFTGVIQPAGIIAASAKKATAGFTGAETTAVTATITASAKKTAASLTGVMKPSGTITSALKKATAGISGRMLPKGTIAASAKKATASLTGVMQPKGTIAVTAKKAAASFSGYEPPHGVLDAVLQRRFPYTFPFRFQTTGVTCEMTGTAAVPQPTGIIAAAAKKTTASLTGAETTTVTATVTASLKKSTANVSGYEHPRGAVVAAAQKLAASFTAEQTQAGTIAATVQKAAASLTGAMQPKGAITATAKAITAALAGGQAQTGTIAATTKKTITDFAAVMLPTGIIIAAVQKLTASLSASHAQTGTIAAAAKAATANIAGTMLPVGAIVTVLQRVACEFNGTAVTPPGTLNATLPRTTANLAGIQPYTATITVTAQKSTTSFTAVMLPTGLISATMTKTAASLAAAQAQTGSVTVTMKPPTFTASGVEHGKGAISVAMKRLACIVTATTTLPPGTVAASLRCPTVTAVGRELPTGVIAATVRTITSSAAGKQIFTAAIAAELQAGGFSGQAAQIQTGAIVSALHILAAAFTGDMPSVSAIAAALQAAVWYSEGFGGITLGQFNVPLKPLRFSGIAVRPTWPSTIRATNVAARPRVTTVTVGLRATTIAARLRITTIHPRLGV